MFRHCPSATAVQCWRDEALEQPEPVLRELGSIAELGLQAKIFSTLFQAGASTQYHASSLSKSSGGNTSSDYPMVISTFLPATVMNELSVTMNANQSAKVKLQSSFAKLLNMNKTRMLRVGMLLLGQTFWKHLKMENFWDIAPGH